MLVIQTLRWVLLGIEALIGLSVLYLSVVSISSIFSARWRKKRPLSFAPPYAHFAILIPAHNEVVLLGSLLESLAALDYPSDRLTICVVADNCTDATAEIARQSGYARVYERFDETKRGKGFALNWLLEQIENDQLSVDAYVILDADSRVNPAFLQVMNKGLAQGAQALQARNDVLNPTDSPSAALRWLALILMNHVRPLGRNTLGFSSNLSGNGMCLTQALLKNYPWQAFGLSEDYQYYLTLVQNRLKVIYMPEAIVKSEMPLTFTQMRTQDIRWEAGQGRQSTLKTAWELLKAGIKKRSLLQIEAIAELLTPPLSILVSYCLLMLISALLLGSGLDLWISLLLVAGVLLYVGTAFYHVHSPQTLLRALLYAPGFILWKIWVVLILKRSKKHTAQWVRTSRNTQ